MAFGSCKNLFERPLLVIWVQTLLFECLPNLAEHNFKVVDFVLQGIHSTRYLTNLPQAGNGLADLGGCCGNPNDTGNEREWICHVAGISKLNFTSTVKESFGRNLVFSGE